MLKPLFSSLFLLCPAFCLAADSLMNLPDRPSVSSPVRTPALGMTLLVPDGRQAIIEEILPNGTFRTSLGQIISSQGLILSGPDAGATIVLQAQEDGSAMNAPQPEKATPHQSTTVAVPGAAQETQAAALENPLRNAPGGELQPEKPEARRLTLAQLLPTTTVPDEKNQAQPEKMKPEEKAAPKRKAEDKKSDAPQKTSAQGKMPAPEPEKKPEPKKPAQPAKTPVGQHLSIPPEAVKTGDLAFLEGCWQGTRPEYYSKRTIKECFCFDAKGGSGKRRVYDPSGGRMCIGASRAHLSSDGVLSVTSGGASCTDGERWGSAEMVCRNSGPSTPCSWVFRDANNGRQSYKIPFVRVESCGR